MAKKRIRVAIIGGGEPDLYVLGELHKRRDVEIAFVYDRHPAAVAIEIAEILGIPRVTSLEEMELRLPVDAAVIGEPRDRYSREIERLGRADIMDHAQALARLCQKDVVPDAPATADPGSLYTIDDAIEGFERLFDRAGLLKFLLNVAVESTGASNGSIMLFSPEARELYIAHATGLSERVVKNTRQKLGEGISGSVAHERKGKLIRQSSVGQHYASSRDRLNISSACSVPLLDGDRLLGVLNVSSTKDGRELSIANLHTLERLSRRIARVLAESIKLQELQVRAGEMQLRQSVGEISEKSTSTAERFSLLASLVAEMTGADSVEVFVSTVAGDWLVLGGSSRRVATEPDLVHVGRGAMARAYLERRSIVLTEPVDPQSAEIASSFAFVPLIMTEIMGVAVLEFSERHRLDQFLAAKDSIALELSRFVASERRETRLRAELGSLARLSEAAPALIACRSVDDLCETVARLTSDALQCDRVSFRVRTSADAPWHVARFDVRGEPSESWLEEDLDRFAKLERKHESFSLSFVEFAPGVSGRGRALHSVLGVPVRSGDKMIGGVIAYDRTPATTVEDSSFSANDESVAEQIIAMALPILRALASAGADARPSYDEMLSGNMHRLARLVDAEMARAERYHTPFSLLIIKVPALDDAFAENESSALVTAEEIRQGIQTRTRNSDYGCWIARDTYAVLSLEGTKRIKFLVSRLVTYLLKDLAGAGLSVSTDDVSVGVASYPGASRTAEALLEEAAHAARPHPGE
jgi:GAF domain-containing protein